MKQAIKNALPQPMFNTLKKAKALFRKNNARARRYTRLIRYAGKSVECPFCGKTFSRFRPTGALERSFWTTPQGRSLLSLDYINVANAMCPWCGSGERHRGLYFYLLDRIHFPKLKGITLLDVAPDGFLTNQFFRRDDMQYISMDLSVARHPNVIMDAIAIGFAESNFDAIICYHVLEHIKDDVAAIKELFRVLKPGGWAIIQVPIWVEKTIDDSFVSPELYENLFGHKDHVRRCGLDYKKRLEMVGFHVKEDDFIGKLPKDQIERYGLFETEKIWFCEKT